VGLSELRDDYDEVPWEEADPDRRNMYADYREWKDKNEYLCVKEAMMKGEDICFFALRRQMGSEGL